MYLPERLRRLQPVRRNRWFGIECPPPRFRRLMRHFPAPLASSFPVFRCKAACDENSPLVIVPRYMAPFGTWLSSLDHASVFVSHILPRAGPCAVSGFTTRNFVSFSSRSVIETAPFAQHQHASARAKYRTVSSPRVNRKLARPL